MIELLYLSRDTAQAINRRYIRQLELAKTCKGGTPVFFGSTVGDQLGSKFFTGYTN